MINSRDKIQFRQPVPKMIAARSLVARDSFFKLLSCRPYCGFCGVTAEHYVDYDSSKQIKPVEVSFLLVNLDHNVLFFSSFSPLWLSSMFEIWLGSSDKSIVPFESCSSWTEIILLKRVKPTYGYFNAGCLNWACSVFGELIDCTAYDGVL